MSGRVLAQGRAPLGLGFVVLVVCSLVACSTPVAKTVDPLAHVISIGTTDKMVSLDPADAFDTGSTTVLNQVYPFLMTTKPGSADVVPDIAESAAFTAANTFTVTLKKGLTFANGDTLTSSDVKFSFDRMVAIADKNGPSMLLYNLVGTAAPAPDTVVFTLKTASDPLWTRVLASSAGAIVDEQVFSPTAVTSDDDIVRARAFAGQYEIEKYQFNQLVRFTAFPKYQGALGLPKTSTVDLHYYATESALSDDIQKGQIDVAARSFSPGEVATLSADNELRVTTGPGAEIRYLVFNLNTQPFGATAANANVNKARAVRQAAADLIDRSAIAAKVYKGSYLPLYSYVPEGIVGANTALRGLYGNGTGGPDLTRARARLAAAGITTPIALTIEFNPDHYGSSSADEYALIRDQLQDGGLFTVTLQSTEWVTYAKARIEDAYPAYQLGWFPDFLDADDYLSPFFGTANFLGSHYDNPTVSQLVGAEAVDMDPAARMAQVEDIQNRVAVDLPTIPLLQGSQVIVSRARVTGVHIDASFTFLFGTLGK